MKKPIVILFLITSFLFSCKKNDTTLLNISGKYKSLNTVDVEEIKMYTQHGEITDKQLIGDYLNRKMITYFTLNNNSEPTGSSVTIDIGLDGKATIFDGTNNNNAELISSNNSINLLAKVDSSETLVDINPVNRCGVLGDLLRTIQPVKKCVDLPRSTGFSAICKFRRLTPFKISGDQLYIPLLSWVASFSTSSMSCHESVGNDWNIFNSSVITQLQANDTLVIQPKKLFFNRQ